MNSVTDIQHILYINLDSRPDRNQLALQEFSKLGWATQPHRFPAVKMAKGAFGCTISHIRCLETAKHHNWPHVLICEDDIKFTQPTVLTENLNRFLASETEWDVIMFAGNNYGPYRPTEFGAVQVFACLAGTSYLVTQHYYDTLLQNFKTGLAHFMREPSNSQQYALDTYWFQLQAKDHWFLIVPLTVTQHSTFSNIENKVLNYDRLMLTLDKRSLVQQQQQQQQQRIKKQEENQKVNVKI
jgi:GR25 family glycosyltransferase involved in LPS biosynthesis